MSEEFVLKSSRNESLKITAFGLEHQESKPCLIFVHGFKGFKDWGFFPFSADYLAQQGFFVLTFNFSHNGIGEIPLEFTEIDKFAENTFSLEIEELKDVIDAYDFGFFGNNAGKGIGLIGHSRGGAISLLTASKRSEVKCVTTWASVSDFDRYSERQKIKWRKEGKFEVLNSRTKQVMRLNVSLLDDLEENKEDKLSIEKAVKDLNKKLLIIHGEQDLAVKVDEAKQIFNWADKNNTELYTVPATGHTFNVSHPFEGSNPNLDLVLNKTSEFFKSNLN